MSETTLLLVDDEESFRKLVGKELARAGLRGRDRGQPGGGAPPDRAESFHRIVLDVRMPDGSGLDLLKEIREVAPTTEVVMLTAYGTVQEAIRAMKEGAHDFLTKPCKLGELEAVLEKAVQKQNLERGNVALQREVDRLQPSDRYVGESAGVRELLQMVARVAETTRPCWCAARAARARSWWRATSTARAAARASRSSWWTVPRCTRTCSRASCAVAGMPARHVPLGRLAAATVRSRALAATGAPGLHACAFFFPETVTWAFGAHACVVEIDVETGVIAVLRYAAVHDCDRPINSMVVEGQLHGGLAQGMGSALLEDLIHDDDAQLLTGTLMDYGLPRADQVPTLHVASVDHPSAINALGIKGVGESGVIAPTAAIANAVEDALADREPSIMRVPLTSVRVWAAARGSVA